MAHRISPQHEANITAKAERACDAIDSLINTRLISDPELPEITDLHTGRAFMLTVLDPEEINENESAAWWVAVGIEHDRMRGHYAYGPGERAKTPTQFATSRETTLAMLDASTWGAQQPVPADPFAGLNGEPF